MFENRTLLAIAEDFPLMSCNKIRQCYVGGLVKKRLVVLCELAFCKCECAFGGVTAAFGLPLFERITTQQLGIKKEHCSTSTTNLAVEQFMPPSLRSAAHQMSLAPVRIAVFIVVALS